MQNDDGVVETDLTGRQLLSDPLLNKGSAFTDDERAQFQLNGLLPLHVSTLEEQLQRTYENFSNKESDLEKYIFLAALQDRNETLFYRLVQAHINEMVPIIYTPTVGEACQKYSHIFRRARGLYLSYPEARVQKQILASAPDGIEIIVVTDGERILGLGDLGAGGMGIPVGKLALYTLCAGIHPRHTLPIFLDVGTNNPSLISDPLYLGWRHARLELEEYDRFIDGFVAAVHERWPRAIVQWEDFSKDNAWRLLQEHRGRLATFNDDIQGTAAVTLAGLLRALRATRRVLRHERIVIVGAGSASTGIARLLCETLGEEGMAREEALASLWLVDSYGLVHEGRPGLGPDKKAFAQRLEPLQALGLDAAQPISLMAVVSRFKPTILLGTSGQAGIFTEPMVRRIAATVERPIIFPLSNPTSKSEASPQQLADWTEGRALVATGSPFPPMTWNGRSVPVGQCNNAFIFPGVGLGLVVSAAQLVPDDVFLIAAKTLADFNKRRPGEEESLFPNLEDVRDVSEEIALCVAREIVRLGLSSQDLDPATLPEKIKKAMWTLDYPILRQRTKGRAS